MHRTDRQTVNLPHGQPSPWQRQRWKVLGFVVGSTLTGLLWAAPASVMERVTTLEAAGEFARADALLAEALTLDRPAPESRSSLEWERERLRRIRLDYSLTADSLFAALERSLHGLTRSEFDRWVEEGRFDSRLIDGERRFVGASVSNLYFRHPRLEARRRKPVNSMALQRSFLSSARAVREAAQQAAAPYAAPRRFQVAMELTVKPGLAGTGELVRCWMPVPRRYPFQGPITVLRSDPAGAWITPESAPLRAAYLEQTAAADGGTRFRIEYAYTIQGVSFGLRADQVTAVDPTHPGLAPFLREAPHVRFTDKMRGLADRIAGREHNPLKRARRYYEWIARNIQYSFAREYSTLPNLGEYCLDHRYGDCGQETFLFMTLCRLSGIPARWQSGWSLFPGAETIHDWCEVYFEPYGWVPVDPYMGIYAMQYTPALSSRERGILRDFYFGGLDPFRLIANGDHNQELVPAKQSFRSDNVDFQRGEVEVGGRNLYFGEFTYSLDWRPLPLASEDQPGQSLRVN